MTDPTGRSFLSYRRKFAKDAELLIAAQHDVGIPTWRDVENLYEDPTEDEIRRVVQHPQTANAILWLTPDVGDASDILKAEVRLALDRSRQDDGFFVIPATARGLTYSQVDTVLGPEITSELLRSWNLVAMGDGPIGPRDAAEIAGRVLRRRTEEIHKALPSGEPLRIALYTREKPPFRPGEIALSLDWHRRFEGREARSGAWEEALLPAIQRVAREVAERAPGRSVQAEGLAALPAAVALGCAFLATRKIPISWLQHMAEDSSEQLWSLKAQREPSGFEGTMRSHDDKGQDLAILVSVTDDVRPSFNRSMRDLPAFRSLVFVGAEKEFPCTIPTAGQALDVARTVVETIKKARRAYAETELGDIHLFMAVPAGLAMLVGQLLNTLGTVQTYECVGPKATGRYRPAARLYPNQ
ncbi:MAG TPA: SAVED domain-containing protein [Thermoanaerobaculia bacterium]